MDLSKLNKEELTQLFDEVIDATVDELTKGEVFAGGPTEPSHGTPGLNDDFAESDKVAASEGATAKADECDEDDKEKKAKPFESEEDEDEEDEKKSDTEVADLVKAQMKGMLNINKAISAINDRLEKISKSKARERKSVMNEKDVEVVEKGNDGEGLDLNKALTANKRGCAEKLFELQKSGKVTGKTVTEYELYGVTKLPEGLKKSIAKELDLLK